MKKINWKILITTSLICLLPIVLGIIYYQEVPQQVAIHFNMNNNPNSYMDKNIVLFLFPVGMAVMQIVCCVLSDLTKQNKNYKPKIEYIYKSIVPIISIVMYCITLSFALGTKLDIRLLVCFMLSMIFILTGNYIPKTTIDYAQSNFTIQSKRLQKKSVRTLGYSFVIFGFLLLISLFFAPIYSVIVVGIIIMTVLIQSIYFYRLSRKSI